ncbi:MAG: hypothetical protein KZQ81_07370 [Candidatus Thiodiazotropha sp. (ex Rostrolucina anterorostrata)]|nr:hypothetical protein [Candidatus Thiodiazotropha sp. (ex Rostrolucina anterorostrata)]
MKKGIIVLIITALPVASWGFYKPMRVLAPELNGLTCINEKICLDDIKKTKDAELLYLESASITNNAIGRFYNNPRAIFCTTEKCYKSFGFKSPSVAHAVGTSGVVISPCGWSNTKIIHEFVHHIQAERIGVISMLFKPDWLIEGMAYYISNDNMNDVPLRYIEAKKRFEKWYVELGNEKLWETAKNL